MTHTTERIPYRPSAWKCRTCGAEWGGERKTCPTVRVRNNQRRHEGR